MEPELPSAAPAFLYKGIEDKRFCFRLFFLKWDYFG